MKEELRIGNWIFDQDCEPYYFQVEQIRRDIGNDLWVFYRKESIKCKAPDPIPLTEEILLKCGFVNGGYDLLFWYKDDIEFYGLNHIDDDNYLSLMTDFGNGENLRIHYLHQLQNLYFALTNQELNVEL